MMRILIRAPASVLALIGKKECSFFVCACPFALLKDFQETTFGQLYKVECSATA